MAVIREPLTGTDTSDAVRGISDTDCEIEDGNRGMLVTCEGNLNRLFEI